MTTTGSLFSGVDGLALGLERATGGQTAWVCERDKAVSVVLAERFPEAPNLGDITAVRWEDVEPVDIICGGFPCQPFSSAGRRQGVSDDRWMWPEFARAVRLLRPRLVLVENVSALVADAGAFGRVLGDLAEIGYDARWTCLRASDVGAPHRRERLFLVADASGSGTRRNGGASSLAQEPTRRREPGHPHPSVAGRPTVADADQSGPQGPEPAERRLMPTGGGASTAYTQEFGPVRSGPARRRWNGPTDDGGAASDPHRGRQQVGPQLDRAANTYPADGRPRRGHPDGRRLAPAEWGAYEPAIRRTGAASIVLKPSDPKTRIRRHEPVLHSRMSEPSEGAGMVQEALHPMASDGRSAGSSEEWSSEDAAGSSILGDGSEDLDMLAVDRGQSQPMGARQVHGSGEELESPSVGLRGDGGADTEWDDARSPLPSAGVCESRPSGTCDPGRERPSARGRQVSLSPRPSPKRSESVPGPQVWLPTLPDLPATTRSEPEGTTIQWGAYGPAIARWEAIHGPAPSPVDDRGRLSPAFVEWMMGFPAGWVTGCPISRSAQLRCLGNAVVPQVAEAAWRVLTEERVAA